MLYEERGTTAVLLDVLVYCPDEYDVLQVEDAATGERLTTGARTAADSFHSRLSVGPDGRGLLVAGWLWHPYGVADVHDFDAALVDASVLDREGALLDQAALDAEVGSACWLDADRVAVSATGDYPSGDEASRLRAGQLGVWSCSGRRWLHRSAGAGDWGTLIACGGNLVASLTEHPRLVDATTGGVLREWPEIRVRHRNGAYGVTHVPSPVAALHPDGTRLAVALETGIAILRIPQT